MMKKKHLMYILLLFLFSIKFIFRSDPLIIKYLSFQKWIPFFFFAQILINEIKEKGFNKKILQKTWFTIPYLIVRGLDIGGIKIPHLTENIFIISLSIIASSVTYQWIKLKSYEKAVGHCLPKTTALMSQFETRLLKGLIKFLKNPNNKSSFILESKSKRLLTLTSVILITLAIILCFISIKFYNENKYVLLSWILLPYALSWPLGILQMSKESEITNHQNKFEFTGLFNFNIFKDNISKITEYSKERCSKSLIFSPLAKKERVIFLKKEIKINFYGREKSIQSIVLPCVIC